MSEVAKPTIVVVEDEYASLEVLGLMLETEGYRVLEATDGVEALAHLEREVPVVVLTDYQMPRLDGAALAHRMSADPRWSAIPVIMMSAAFPEDVELPSNVIGRFAKPLSFSRLLEMVKRIVLGGAAPSQG